MSWVAFVVGVLIFDLGFVVGLWWQGHKTREAVDCGMTLARLHRESCARERELARYLSMAADMLMAGQNEDEPIDWSAIGL